MNIVFDFGAVLVNWQPQTLLQAHFPQSASGPSEAAALAQAFFHHDDWQAFDRGVMLQAEVCRRTAERLALPHDDVHALVSNIADLLTPMNGTVQLLERLRARRQTDTQLRLYFLSNMPEPYARTLERTHSFLTWFDGGIFSGDVRHIKPEPAIYELLETRYGLVPGRTLFIDDLHANVQAARDRGWHAVHFESPEQLEAQLLVHGF